MLYNASTFLFYFKKYCIFIDTIFLSIMLSYSPKYISYYNHMNTRMLTDAKPQTILLTHFQLSLFFALHLYTIHKNSRFFFLLIDVRYTLTLFLLHASFISVFYTFIYRRNRFLQPICNLLSSIICANLFLLYYMYYFYMPAFSIHCCPSC